MFKSKISRYYVNFPSPVDGKILCEFFRTAEQAKNFAKRFSLKYYYEIDFLECYKGTLHFIEQEIYKCNTDENYKFMSETHYLMENVHYL